MSKATYSQKVIQNSQSTTLSPPQIRSQKYRGYADERETSREDTSAGVPRHMYTARKRANSKIGS